MHKKKCGNNNQNVHHWFYYRKICLILKPPNTTIAKLAKTADPDEMAHYELSHLDLQCLPYSL